MVEKTSWARFPPPPADCTKCRVPRGPAVGRFRPKVAGPSAVPLSIVQTVRFPARIIGMNSEQLANLVREQSLDVFESKLNSYRRKDQTHLLDMIQIGLLDETWPSRFPSPLAHRLQALLDDPEG